MLLKFTSMLLQIFIIGLSGYYIFLSYSHRFLVPEKLFSFPELEKQDWLTINKSVFYIKIKNIIITFWRSRTGIKVTLSSIFIIVRYKLTLVFPCIVCIKVEYIMSNHALIIRCLVVCYPKSMQRMPHHSFANLAVCMLH